MTRRFEVAAAPAARSNIAFDGIDALLMLAGWTVIGIVLLPLAERIWPHTYSSNLGRWVGMATFGLPLARRAIFGAPVRVMAHRATLLGTLGLLLLTLGFLAGLLGAWMCTRPAAPPTPLDTSAICGPNQLIYASPVTGNARVDAELHARAAEEAHQDCIEEAQRLHAAADQTAAENLKKNRLAGVCILLCSAAVVALGWLLDWLRIRLDAADREPTKGLR
jgi:hypothetical protein